MKTNKNLIYLLSSISLFFIAVLFFFQFEEKENTNPILSHDTIKSTPVMKIEYGIQVDSFDIVRAKIKRNQTLSKILNSYNISQTIINELVIKSEGIFNLRKIKYGNKYCVFMSADSLRRAFYLIYEDTPIEYIVFKLTDSIYVRREKKTIDYIERKAELSIQNSLWNTMIDNNMSPLLAIELSEIYAWSIDFFGLMKGDSIKVIYDEQYIDTQSIGIGKIHAAYFKHNNKDFFAIPFIQNGRESFYDIDGNSLRKAFLKAPLRFSRISSRYSHSRMHPILKIRRPHYGVDYAAPIGTPAHAIGDGKVIKARYSGGAGKMVKIRHNSVYTSAYLHLSHYGKGIKEGAFVKQGDIIGYIGSTGLSTGPHLDFRIYKNGHPVDPLKIEAPSVDPIQETNRKLYDSIKNVALTKLELK